MNKTIAVFLLTLSLLPNAHAADEGAALAPIVKEHVVEPGDTLAKLARRYLGADAPWNINVQFNPGLANPNQLVPGQKINVITGYAAPEPEPAPEPEIVVEEVETYQAVIEQIANEVEKNVKQTDWRSANSGDELFPLDAVRTLSNSSALLRFDGTSEILISEYSQVFLRAFEARESGVDRSEIEIKRGETELRLTNAAAPEQQIEINVAGVITRPERGSDGTNATRARLAGTSTSQVMVYEGESKVESAGVSVAVERGMGTTAKSGEAPAAPERLLAAPAILTIDVDLYQGENRFAWEGVDGAAGYRLEVCKDRRCTEPVRMLRDLQQAFAILNDLPAGLAFWRVTAVSASGLDGFTSNPDQIRVVEAPPPIDKSWLAIVVAVVTIGLTLLLLISTYRSMRHDHKEDADA